MVKCCFCFFLIFPQWAGRIFQGSWEGCMLSWYQNWVSWKTPTVLCFCSFWDSIRSIRSQSRPRASGDGSCKPCWAPRCLGTADTEADWAERDNQAKSIDIFIYLFILLVLYATLKNISLFSTAASIELAISPGEQKHQLSQDFQILKFFRSVLLMLRFFFLCIFFLHNFCVL